MKTSLAYIEKALKATVVSLGTAAFLLTGSLFCCLTATQTKTTVPSCHAHKASKPAQNSQTCDCCKVSKNSEQANKIFELVQAAGKDLKAALVFDQMAQVPQRVFTLHLSSSGPPRAAPLPIYLKLSNFRL